MEITCSYFSFLSENTYLELHKELVQESFLQHTQDYLKGIKKPKQLQVWEQAWKSHLTHTHFDEGSVFIFFFYSNNQHCFYKISHLKTRFCSNHRPNTPLQKVSSKHLSHEAPLIDNYTFFACCFKNVCCFQRLLSSPQSLFLFQLSSQVERLVTSNYNNSTARYKFMKYLPRLLCLCYIRDHLESSRMLWNLICEGSDAEM